jgi:SNF2 family DNA or RNA helicase
VTLYAESSPVLMTRDASAISRPSVIQNSNTHSLVQKISSAVTPEALARLSGKLALVSALVPRLADEGHRMLIFSRSVRVLKMIEGVWLYTVGN